MLYYLVLGIYAGLGFIFLVGSRRAGGLKSVLLVSYCGVALISFTTGVTASMWLATAFLYLLAWPVVTRKSLPPFNSRSVMHLTYAVFVIYMFGIVVAYIRYDPSLEIAKAGVAKSFFGLPLSFLMAGYRFATLFSLILAFMLPLRYSIDRKLFLQCIAICWFFSIILSIVVIMDHVGVADLRLSGSYRVLTESEHFGVLGFLRPALGMMLLVSVFLSFAMAQVTKSFTLKFLVYSSIPVLLAGLLFSHSRAAGFGLFVGAVSLAITLGGVRAIKGICFTLLGAIVCFLILSSVPETGERMTGWFAGDASFYETSSGRIEGWIQLLSWIIQKPSILVFGAGFQNFNYLVKLQESGTTLAAGHNNFLHMLTEAGFVGFIAFPLWLSSIAFWLISWRRSVVESKRKIIPGIILAMVFGACATCLTQESLSPAPVMISFLLFFYVILGLCISYYRNEMMELYYPMEMHAEEADEIQVEDYYQSYEYIETY